MYLSFEHAKLSGMIIYYCFYLAQQYQCHVLQCQCTQVRVQASSHQDIMLYICIYLAYVHVKKLSGKKNHYLLVLTAAVSMPRAAMSVHTSARAGESASRKRFHSSCRLCKKVSK